MKFMDNCGLSLPIGGLERADGKIKYKKVIINNKFKNLTVKFHLFINFKRSVSIEKDKHLIQGCRISAALYSAEFSAILALFCSEKGHLRNLRYADDEKKITMGKHHCNDGNDKTVLNSRKQPKYHIRRFL